MAKTFFGKGNSAGKKSKDFSVKTITATEAIALLRTTVKTKSDQEVDEATDQIIGRSFRGPRPDFTSKQKRLILGIYIAVISGFDQMNLTVICKGLGITRNVWYSLLQEGSQERTQAIRRWVEDLLKDADLGALGAIKASLKDQAMKGSAKHQELWLKLNGYLAPDQATPSSPVTFQIFREMPKEPVEGAIDADHSPGPMIPKGAMPQDQVDSLLPFLDEAEPVPPPKPPNPHGDRYNRPNHFSGEPLV